MEGSDGKKSNIDTWKRKKDIEEDDNTTSKDNAASKLQGESSESDDESSDSSSESDVDDEAKEEMNSYESIDIMNCSYEEDTAAATKMKDECDMDASSQPAGIEDQDVGGEEVSNTIAEDDTDHKTTSDDDDKEEKNTGEDEHKTRKRARSVDATDPLSESRRDDTDDESAPIEKPKGLSPHCPGKSKSFGDLTKLGNMRTEEIVKKEKTKYKKRRIQMHREAGEAQQKLENAIGRLAATTIDMADEDPEEGEVDDDDDNKATDEEEEDDAEKSKGGASGAQSDHSMPEAGSSGRDIAQTDDMTVELRRVQFTPADRDYFLYGGGGDSDDDDEDDFDDDYEDADEDDDEEYDDYDDDDDDDDDDGDDDDGATGAAGMMIQMVL